MSSAPAHRAGGGPRNKTIVSATSSKAPSKRRSAITGRPATRRSAWPSRSDVTSSGLSTWRANERRSRITVRAGVPASTSCCTSSSTRSMTISVRRSAISGGARRNGAESLCRARRTRAKSGRTQRADARPTPRHISLFRRPFRSVVHRPKPPSQLPAASTQQALTPTTPSTRDRPLGRSAVQRRALASFDQPTAVTQPR